MTLHTTYAFSRETGSAKPAFKAVRFLTFALEAKTYGALAMYPNSKLYFLDILFIDTNPSMNKASRIHKASSPCVEETPGHLTS